MYVPIKAQKFIIENFDKMSFIAMSKELGVNRITVSAWARSMGLTHKTRSVSMQGQVFNRLLVIEDIGTPRVKVKCVCGEVFETLRQSLRDGKTRSCGCLKRDIYKYIKQGMSQEDAKDLAAKVKYEKTDNMIKVVNKSCFGLPQYQTPMSAGVDLQANILEPITLGPLQRAVVPTGLFIELPQGFEAQVRPRSGLAAKKGITVLNAPGTIDADYRGEIGVILVNLSNEDFTIERGERIAQLVFARYEQIEWDEVAELSSTERGQGGFGHTGK